MNSKNRTFPWNAKPQDVKSFKEDGITWVPITGNRITPEMAEKRKAHPEVWKNEAYTNPAYDVEFVPSNSLLLSAIGRLC